MRVILGERGRVVFDVSAVCKLRLDYGRDD
jgi:hypothetical protein